MLPPFLCHPSGTSTKTMVTFDLSSAPALGSTPLWGISPHCTFSVCLTIPAGLTTFSSKPHCMSHPLSEITSLPGSTLKISASSLTNFRSLPPESNQLSNFLFAAAFLHHRLSLHQAPHLHSSADHCSSLLTGPPLSSPSPKSPPSKLTFCALFHGTFLKVQSRGSYFVTALL